jgi:hypothetical protein
MSGSVTTVEVQLSAAELARIARERARRQALRSAMDDAATARLRVSAAAARGQTSAERVVGRGRAARRAMTDRVAVASAGASRRAVALAADARRHGLDGLADAVARARDARSIAALEAQLDDAIDIALTRAAVEERLDRVGRALLGAAWDPQAPPEAAVARSHATTILGSVEVDRPGRAIVGIGIDAAVAELNGVPVGTCDEQCRASRSIALGLAEQDGLELASPPSSGGATVAGLLGLTDQRARARATARAAAEPPR